MRKIKFRGKTVFGDRWVYGGILQGESGIYIIEPDANIIDSIIYKIDPDTIGQFTELFDKDGKEIYEGDVVKFKFQHENIGVVKWDEVNPCFCIEYHDNRYSKMIDWEYDFVKCGRMIIEVVGDIHDDPELMKGGER